MKVNEPTFAVQERLARHIRPEYCQGNNRAKLGAFLEDDAATKNGLSVNSLEIHTENQIAAIYAKKNNQTRRVAISTPTIREYNDAADSVKISMLFDVTKNKWMHKCPTGSEESYKHDPRKNNESHCLIKYTCLFVEFQAFRFAQRMAYKPRYRVY